MCKIPEYWNDYLQDKIKTIRKKQLSAGKDGTSFALITDIHWDQNEQHTGAILEKILLDCSIPYFFNAGDLVSGHALCPQEELYEEIASYRQAFSNTESKCLIVLGNHDTAYSTFDEPVYYAENAPMERFYEYYFRPYTIYPNRTFSKDGTYYYADDENHKTRYIVLNCNDIPSEETTEEGYAKYNRMRHFGFLQTQLDWLANTALAFAIVAWLAFSLSIATSIAR